MGAQESIERLSNSSTTRSNTNTVFDEEEDERNYTIVEVPYKSLTNRRLQVKHRVRIRKDKTTQSEIDRCGKVAVPANYQYYWEPLIAMPSLLLSI